MPVKLVIAGSRGVFPSVGEIDFEVSKLPLPWDGDGDDPEGFTRALRRMIVCVVDGGADGGDYAGFLWAEAHGLPIHPEPITDADVSQRGKYFAPKMRNRRMAEVGDMGLVFWDGQSTGCIDFVARMHLRRKHVEIVPSKIMKGRPRRPRDSKPTTLWLPEQPSQLSPP